MKGVAIGAFDLALRVRAKAWLARYVTNPPARLLIALHVSANAVTLIGLAIMGGAAYLVSEGHLLIGGLVMLGGAALDMLDGPIARLSDSATRFGAYLDSLCDRVGEAAVIFGLLAYAVREGHTLGAYLAFGAVVVSMLVSYSRARAEGLGVEGDVGLLGRPERIIVLGVGLLVGYPNYALMVILAAAGLTVVQRSWHVLRRTGGS